MREYRRQEISTLRLSVTKWNSEKARDQFLNLNETIRFKTRLGVGDENLKMGPWRKKNANSYTTKKFLLRQEKLITLGAEKEMNKKSNFWRKEHGLLSSVEGKIFNLRQRSLWNMWNTYILRWF